MIRDFSKEELAPAEISRDAEFTLGGGSLLFIAVALLALCAGCFAVGYVAGRGKFLEKATATVLPDANTKPPSLQPSSAAKPGAAAQMPVPAAGQADSPVDPAANPDPNRPNATASEAESQQHSASGTQLPNPSSTSSLQVQPATQAQGWMVQIAAVSHLEDAEVLVDALRKRGYAVTARRVIGDNMIHVQTGPFMNRNDANVMRQKLLNDGYNAIVE